jgi:hypothetical protein
LIIPKFQIHSIVSYVLSILYSFIDKELTTWWRPNEWRPKHVVA